MDQKPTYEELEQRIRTLEEAESKRNTFEDTTSNTSGLLSFFIKHSPVYAFLKKISQKESQVLYASDNYIDMIGVPASQMIGKTMHDLFPSDFADKITRDDYTVIEKGESLKIHEKLDGKHYITYKFPLTQGANKYLAGYTVDITDLKKVEHDLTQIFTMSLDMICIADINTATFIKVNPAFTEVLGYTEEELLDKSFLDFIHPEDIESTQTIIERELQQGFKIINFENRYRCKAGGYRWLSWFSRPDAEKGVSYAVARDVTEQKNNEAILKEKEDLLEATGRIAKVGGWELDLETQKVVWTQMVGRIHELPNGYVPDLDEAITFYHPDDRQKVSESVQRAIAKGESYEFEARLITAKGRLRWIRAIGQPTVKAGECIRLSGTFQDISDQKKTELELKRRITYEETLAKISSELAGARMGHVDQAIVKSLSTLSSFVGADRCYVFQVNSNASMDNTHEWCARGITPQRENLKNIALEHELPWFMEHINNREIFYVPDVSALPEKARLEREHFDSQDIKSLLVVPIQTAESLMGFIGFDAVREHREWNHDDISLLQYVSHTLFHIIEAQRIEASLRRREFIFSQTFEQSSTSTCFYDPEGTIVRVNKEFCKMFGVKEQNILDSRYNIFNDQAIVDAGVVPILREIFKEKKTRQWEINFDINKASDSPETPASKQEKIYLEVFGYPVVNHQNELQFVVLKHYDITKRKQVKEKLFFLEKRNQALLDNSPVCHKIVDFDFNLQYMSASGFKMLKLDHAADVYDKPYPFKFFPSKFREKMTERLKRVKETGEKLTFTALANDAEGNEVWLDSTVVPVMDEHGETQYMTVVSDNITQRRSDDIDKRHLERQLAQSQKMESIGTLAGGIAHDFNNILSVVLGFTELAKEQVECDSAIYSDLKEVYKAGVRAKELVGQILAFARQSDEKQQPLQVDVIVKEAIKFLRSTIPTSIEITQTLASKSLIMGNPTRIHQIFMNLCMNAVQAMEHDSGILDVSLQDVTIKPDDSKILGLRSGSYMEIKVSDNGVGIAQEQIKQIFEPYYTTKKQGEGTGLGLSVVHGIVESYGGKITVASTPGHGTTFTTYLPVISDRKSESTNVSEVIPLGNEQVLLVDDEAPIVRMGAKMLEGLGYEVTTRTSSLEALDLFRSRADIFDLVITDMTMPNMTGDDLAREVKTISPNTPIILCTGFSKKISEEFARELGIDGFAYKPIVKSEFAKLVRRVIDDAKGIVE